MINLRPDVQKLAGGTPVLIKDTNTPLDGKVGHVVGIATAMIGILITYIIELSPHDQNLLVEQGLLDPGYTCVVLPGGCIVP